MIVHDGSFRTRPSKTHQLRGFGGDWEDWCDRAADLWPGSDRETLRAKCKDQPLGPASMNPATSIGHATRGLPANFSTDPKVVASGEGGALLRDAGQVVSTVSSTVSTVSGGGGGKTGVGGSGGRGGQTGLQQTFTTTAAKAKKYWPFILGGVVLLAGIGFAATRSRPAPMLPAGQPVAGYRRRKRRRSRR